MPPQLVCYEINTFREDFSSFFLYSSVILMSCAHVIRVVLDKRDNKHRVFGLATDTMFQNVTAKKAQYRQRDNHEPVSRRDAASEQGLVSLHTNSADVYGLCVI